MTSSYAYLYKDTVKVIDLAANNPSASDQYNGKTMTVTGWGKTADGILVGTSNVLMEVDVVGITKAECARTYGTIITDNIVCVSTTGGHGTCNVRTHSTPFMQMSNIKILFKLHIRVTLVVP